MTYYLYDPGYCEYTPQPSLDAALASATSLINEYRDQCDPEWPEYVEGIMIYDSSDPETAELVARSVDHNRIERPDDVDEDGYSPSYDLWFDQVDFYVDYRMEVVCAS